MLALLQIHKFLGRFEKIVLLRYKWGGRLDKGLFLVESFEVSLTDEGD